MYKPDCNEQCGQTKNSPPEANKISQREKTNLKTRNLQCAMRKMISRSSITSITTDATFDEACNLPLQCTPSRPPKKANFLPVRKMEKRKHFLLAFSVEKRSEC